MKEHPMGYVIGVLVLVLALAGLTRLLAKRTRPATAGKKHPFRKKDYLLTKAERSFYEVLCQAVDSRLAVFAKIRLWDLLYLPKGVENAQAHRNRVQSKHVDFVLCDRAALKPVLVIELDDASHERESRQARDSLVDDILAAAGLPVLRVRARQGYVTSEIRQQIDSAMSAPASQ